MTRPAAAVLALTSLIISSSAAFAPATTSTTFAARRCAFTTASSPSRAAEEVTTTFLRMSDEENAQQQATLDDNNNEAELSSEEEEDAPKEDPAVTELKETISKLEATLKSKRSDLNNLKDMADKYSQSGYARQVAQVENNKRMRGANMADSKDAARATVLQSFLPVLDEMDAIAAKYEGNAFAGTLQSGLTSEFQNTLNEMGVAEYIVASGDDVVMGRVVAIEEEYSEEFGKGTVITPLKSGLEIQGNIVRPAECVASLGSEAAAAAEEEAAAAEADAAAEEGSDSAAAAE
jgi:molecular chaperone GrpE (heat shock protein)